MLELHIDVDTPPRDAAKNVFAEAGFQFSEVAGHIEDDLSLLAVDRRSLDADDDVFCGMGAAAKSGHTVHGREISVSREQ